MRLWSLHPSSLDRKRLGGVWREGLLALHVLDGRTKGYRSHPQLDRFKDARDPLQLIAYYLFEVAVEACSRGYTYDVGRIDRVYPLRRVRRCGRALSVTSGQIDYERQWLAAKLDVDAREVSRRLHPLFHALPGPVADWERAKPLRRTNRP